MEKHRAWTDKYFLRVGIIVMSSFNCVPRALNLFVASKNGQTWFVAFRVIEIHVKNQTTKK